MRSRGTLRFNAKIASISDVIAALRDKEHLFDLIVHGSQYPLGGRWLPALAPLRGDAQFIEPRDDFLVLVP